MATTVAWPLHEPRRSGPNAPAAWRPVRGRITREQPREALYRQVAADPRCGCGCDRSVVWRAGPDLCAPGPGERTWGVGWGGLGWTMWCGGMTLIPVAYLVLFLVWTMLPLPIVLPKNRRGT